jgi:hypothetical protein
MANARVSILSGLILNNINEGARIAQMLNRTSRVPTEGVWDRRKEKKDVLLVLFSDSLLQPIELALARSQLLPTGGVEGDSSPA